jgi:hypothetical protein
MNAPLSPTRLCFEASAREALIEDATRVIQVAPFIARYPTALWSVGLASELAEATDIINAKLAAVQEAQGADR